MWGLSGLKTLNLGHNKLTNVIDQNFDGTWHPYELPIVTLNIIYSMIHSLSNIIFIFYRAILFDASRVG